MLRAKSSTHVRTRWPAMLSNTALKGSALLIFGGLALPLSVVPVSNELLPNVRLEMEPVLACALSSPGETCA
eukprot:scaffold41391_cov16-Tisochrysis_lutea.AAC.1